MTPNLLSNKYVFKKNVYGRNRYKSRLELWEDFTALWHFTEYNHKKEVLTSVQFYRIIYANYTFEYIGSVIKQDLSERYGVVEKCQCRF